MKLTLATKKIEDLSSEYLILPIFEKEKPDYGVEETALFLKDNLSFGKLFETEAIFTGKRYILLAGIGERADIDFAKLQNWAGTAVKNLSKKAKSASMVVPVIDSLTPEQVGLALSIGAEIVSHDPAEQYKTDYQKNKLTDLELIVEKNDPAYQDGLKKGLIIVEGINLVRRLGDTPPNDMTPSVFLKVAKKIALDNKLKLTVLTESQAKKKGMGAFVGVAQGSDEPSYMIALEYRGAATSKEKWGLIGKGITFDTGGISLKPGDNMHEMKYDMLGAATVLGTLSTLARLKVKANVVGIMAVTENLPSGKAQRPGDIVRTYSGKTAEILNTDAEGRLVLVDALTYAQKDFGATKLVDLATLTGAIIIALGHNYTGVFSNNAELADELIRAGAKLGEKYWQMPMDPEFDDLIKTEFADMANIGPRGEAGSIAGAKFLEKVIEDDRPWAHLDTAGTAWDMKQKPYRHAGATGVGLKTLVELISHG